MGKTRCGVNCAYFVQVVFAFILGGLHVHGLAPPSYVSDWKYMYTREAGKREHVFYHEFNELPVKVDVQVEPGGDNNGFYFPGIGSGQSANEVLDRIGGAIYMYNTTSVIVKIPDGHSNEHMKALSTGNAWTNKNDQSTTDVNVRVRAWRIDDFPAASFSSGWLPISVIDSDWLLDNNLTRVVVNASDGVSSDLAGKYVSVRVLIRDNGPLENKVCDAQGSSLAFTDGTIWGGLIYRVTDNIVDIWAPAYVQSSPDGYGSLCNMAGGWGEMDEGYGISGVVSVDVYDLLENETHSTTTVETDYGILEGGNEHTYTGGPINATEDIVDAKVWNNDKGQNQFIHWAVMGGALFPKDSGETYGGIIFAYNDNAFRLWAPSNNQTFYIDDHWGTETNPTIYTNTMLSVYVYRVTQCYRQISGTVVSYRYGSIVVFVCPDGTVQISGDLVWKCEHHGWNGTQAYCAYDCGSPPSIEDGVLIPYNCTTGGCEVFYTCNEGYMLSGYNSMQCNAFGNWVDHIPTCQLIDCGFHPSPVDGSVSYTGTTFGRISTVTCDPGYTIIGDSVRSCTDSGTWNGTDVTCMIVDCGFHPSPDNGSVSYTGTTFGSISTVTCHTGYTIFGESVRICTDSGTWNGTDVTCMIVDCGFHPFTVNGSVSYTGTTFGSISTVTCHPGFTIIGDSVRICTDSGTWNGTDVTCMIVDCGLHPSPANGSVSHTGTTFGSISTVMCDPGYTMIGDSVRACTDSGTWNGTYVTCMIVDCGQLNEPDNGSVSTSNGSSYNSLADYSCEDGYLLTGSQTRTCSASGIWSGSEPFCEYETCYCEVNDVTTSALSETTSAEHFEELIAELTVDKTTTSKSVRSKTSAEDPRTSSKLIGASGVIFISVIFAFLLTLDLVTVCQYFNYINTTKKRHV